MPQDRYPSVLGLLPLAFERVWTSTSDFPTYQTSEDIVRADLQYHPDKLKVAHNELLSAIDYALGKITADIVNRYTKSESDTLLTARTQNSVEDIQFNSETGTFTILKKGGQSYEIDTTIEKLPVRCELVTEGYETFFVITNDDGSTFRTNVTSLLNTYTFADSNTLAFTTTQQEDGSYRTTAEIKDASVTLEKLALDATAYIEGNVAAAAASETNAKASETNAAASAILAQTAQQNAEAAQHSAEEAEEAASASEQNAKTSETAARESATAAAESAAQAAADRLLVAQYSSQANDSAEAASNSAAYAEQCAATAAERAEAALADEMNDYIFRAQNAEQGAEAAQAAAEKARDEAREIAGGDFATNAVVTEKFAAANAYTDEQIAAANAYTDEQIAKIPTPDVSGQIGEHNASEDAHPDIRDLIDEKIGAIPTPDVSRQVGEHNASDVAHADIRELVTAAQTAADSAGKAATASLTEAKAYTDGKIAAIPAAVFSFGASAPSDTNLLWIDTNASTGGLKYYNGSAWVHVPVAFT